MYRVIHTRALHMQHYVRGTQTQIRGNQILPTAPLGTPLRLGPHVACVRCTCVPQERRVDSCLFCILVLTSVFDGMSDVYTSCLGQSWGVGGFDFVDTHVHTRVYTPVCAYYRNVCTHAYSCPCVHVYTRFYTHVYNMPARVYTQSIHMPARVYT